MPDTATLNLASKRSCSHLPSVVVSSLDKREPTACLLLLTNKALKDNVVFIVNISRGIRNVAVQQIILTMVSVIQIMN